MWRTSEPVAERAAERVAEYGIQKPGYAEAKWRNIDAWRDQRLWQNM